VREGGRDARGLAPRPARARGGRRVPPPLPHAPDRAGEGRGDAAGPPGRAPGRLGPPRGRPPGARRPRAGAHVSAGFVRDVTYRSCGGEELASLAPFVSRVFEEEFDAPVGDGYAREAAASAVVFDPRRDVLVTAASGDTVVGVVLVVPGGGA